MTIDWGTAIPIMVAFGSATTAQIISHRFAEKREENKYKKESLQNLYSPVIFQIVEYIQFENAKAIMKADGEFEEENPLNPRIVFERIMETTGQNMKYAQPELIMRYEVVKSTFTRSSKEKNDDRYMFEIKMELCGEFLMEFIKISSEIGTLSRAVEDKINPTLFFTQFYLLLKELGCWMLTDILLLEFHLLKDILLPPENEFLEKILDVRKNINYELETHYKNKSISRASEACEAGYQFVHEVIKEFIEFHPKQGGYWMGELEEVLNDNIEYEIELEKEMKFLEETKLMERDRL